MNVLNEWAFIGIFAVMAPVFPALPIVIAWLFRPRKPNVLKSSTYECGVEDDWRHLGAIPRSVLHLWSDFPGL